MASSVALAVLLSLPSAGVFADGASKEELLRADPLEVVFGRGPDKGYLSRIKAVHRLPLNLASADVEAIYRFLSIRRAADEPLSNLEYNAVKNDLVRVLMLQREHPEKLSSKLVEMYRDMEMDVTWRNYCIQFMGQWYPKEPSEERRKEMKEALHEALKEREGGLPGTALLALKGLRSLPGFDAAAIAGEAYSLTIDPEVKEIDKITSLQIGAELGDKRLLAVARETLKDSSNCAQLRMSAMVAIGFLGDASDAELLEKYAKGSDTHLRLAARQALKKLSP